MGRAETRRDERAARKAREVTSLPDLSKLRGNRLIGQLAQEAQASAEAVAGMRCMGCHRRITAGYEFVRFRVYDVPGRPKPEVRLEPTFACNRKDCDYRFKAAEEADAMRPVQWAWLDDDALKKMMAVAPTAEEPSEAEADDPPAA